MPKSVVVNGVEWDVKKLKTLLATNDQAVVRGMKRIFEYQTEVEQRAECTEDRNGVGFSGVDGEILASFCKQHDKFGCLSEKQMLLARKKMQKYAGQLLKIMAGEQKPSNANVTTYSRYGRHRRIWSTYASLGGRYA